MKTLDLTETVSSVCLIVLGVAASGCAAAAESDAPEADAACTPSVETHVHPARLASNGLWENGTSLNGIQNNGSYVNGLWSNGTSLDGLSASDVEIGAVRLDRVELTVEGELVASTAES